MVNGKEEKKKRKVPFKDTLLVLPSMSDVFPKGFL